MTGRAWAYVGAVLGGAVSVAANVAHSYVPPDGAPGQRLEPTTVDGRHGAREEDGRAAVLEPAVFPVLPVLHAAELLHAAAVSAAEATLLHVTLAAAQLS